MMCSKTLTTLEYTCLVIARPSHLITLSSWKLKQSLYRVDNRRTMRGSQNDALEWVRGNRIDSHYGSVVTLHELYISHSSCADSNLTFLHFSLRVFLSPSLNAMEDKRGTKHPRSPSKEGSSSLSSVLTPPSALSGSPPPPGSLLEDSSCHHYSLFFE
jgi:hypothetical protein